MFKLFPACPQCKTTHFIAFLKKELYCCNRCGYLFRLTAAQRLGLILDRGSFNPLAGPAVEIDPLDFPDYRAKMREAQKKTGLKEAILTGTGQIKGIEVAIAVMDSRFIMASMGAYVGEAVCCLIDLAVSRSLPLVMVICSGGARMQEGVISLLQMAKTSASVARLHQHRLPYFALLTDPTTGGVTASFAMLADVIMAEKGSLIGFAGPRVIQQTIGQTLPEGFQKAEFLLEHGVIDLVLERREVRPTLERLLLLHGKRPYPQAREES